MAGFHELIPADLVNVFDERELELLIGGIADIDVDDWKKHTDYRGYTESDAVIVYFWKVSYSDVACKDRQADKKFSASDLGTPSRSLVCCSLLLVHPVFLSTASRICKDLMDREGSRSRSLARRDSCRRLILASTDLISRHTRLSKHCRTN